MPVDFAWDVAVAPRWKDVLNASRFDRFDPSVTVVVPVDDDRTRRKCLDQCSPLRGIGDLVCPQNQTNQVAKGVDTGMDLGTQPTPQAPDR